MKSKILLVFLLPLTVAFCQKVMTQASVQPANLRTEYLNNPIGIDEAHPRLSWMLKDDKKGAAQSAYRLFVGTDSTAVSRNIGNSWSTAKITSSASLISYIGSPLVPFTKYYWKVEFSNAKRKASGRFVVLWLW
jgi:alpha-L-rhamnosidase